MFIFSCGTNVELETNENVPKNIILQCNYTQDVTVNWEYEYNNAIGFLINRKQADGQYTIIDSVAENSFNYVDFDLNISETYFFKIAAVTSEGRTDWSSEKSIFIKSGFKNLNFGEDDFFEIITWNIEEFPKANSETIDLLVQLIPIINADVYALQEIKNSNYFSTLLQEINDIDTLNTWMGFRANSAAYDINLAYIYKSNEMTLETDIYEIYQNEYYFLPRSPLVMEVEWNGTKITIINNHLKAFSDEESEERRRQGCILLENYIVQNLSNENVVLLGDLNDSLLDSEINNVFNPFLNNSSLYEFADISIANGNSSEWSLPPSAHFDHILITNELFDEFGSVNSEIRTLKIDEYLDDGFSEYDDNISNHRPVGIKLNLGE